MPLTSDRNHFANRARPDSLIGVEEEEQVFVTNNRIGLETAHSVTIPRSESNFVSLNTMVEFDALQLEFSAKTRAVSVAEIA